MKELITYHSLKKRDSNFGDFALKNGNRPNWNVPFLKTSSFVTLEAVEKNFNFFGLREILGFNRHFSCSKTSYSRKLQVVWNEICSCKLLNVAISENSPFLSSIRFTIQNCRTWKIWTSDRSSVQWWRPNFSHRHGQKVINLAYVDRAFSCRTMHFQKN